MVNAASQVGVDFRAGFARGALHVRIQQLPFPANAAKACPVRCLRLPLSLQADRRRCRRAAGNPDPTRTGKTFFAESA